MNGVRILGGDQSSQITPPLYRAMVPLVPTVRLFVDIAGRHFQAEADTLPAAEDIITEKVSAAIEECGEHIERMEGFLAAR